MNPDFVKHRCRYPVSNVKKKKDVYISGEHESLSVSKHQHRQTVELKQARPHLQAIKFKTKMFKIQTIKIFRKKVTQIFPSS